MQGKRGLSMESISGYNLLYTQFCNKQYQIEIHTHMYLTIIPWFFSMCIQAYLCIQTSHDAHVYIHTWQSCEEHTSRRNTTMNNASSHVHMYGSMSETLDSYTTVLHTPHLGHAIIMRYYSVAYFLWQSLSHPAGQIWGGDPLPLHQTLPPLPSLPPLPPPLSLPLLLCYQMMFWCNVHSIWVRFCRNGVRVAWRRLAWLLRGAVHDIAARCHGRGQEWWPVHVGVHVDAASTYTHVHVVEKQEQGEDCLSRSSCFRESQLEVFNNHVDTESLYRVCVLKVRCKNKAWMWRHALCYLAVIPYTCL